MTLTVRQFVAGVAVSFCVGATVSPLFSQSQATAGSPAESVQQQGPTFMQIDYMKITPGQEETWMKLESEQWKPLHDVRIKEGALRSWSLIVQQIPGDERHGDVAATITTYPRWPNPTDTDWSGLMKRAHPQGDFMTMLKKTEAARKIVRTELWQVLAHAGK